MSIIPTTRSAARTPGPAEGSCASSSARKSELLLSGDYGRFDGVPLTYAKPIAAKPPGSASTAPASLWEVRTSHLASGKNTQQGTSARLTIPLNATTTLNSLTAYRKSNYRFFIDADATELTLQTSDVPDLQHQFSQELTIVQRTPKVTWIGGVFFYEDHNEGQVEITVYPSPLRFGRSRRSEQRPGRCSARLRIVCRAACR